MSRNLLMTKAFMTSCCVLFFGFWYVCNMFTGNGVTDAVFYHLFSGVKGSSLDDIKSKIAIALAFILMIIFIFIICYKKKRKLISHQKLKLKIKLSDCFFVLAIVLFFTQAAAAKILLIL